MADDHTPAPVSSYPATEAQLHYKSLTDYFKFLVTLTLGVTLGGIGILTTVGLYFSYKDMAAMRAEVRQNLSDVKADVRQNMSDAKSDTKAVVDKTRDDAKTSIESVKVATDAQISQIRDRSAAIAISEAQRRVDEAFHNRNIEGMVESAASRQVAPVIERQLKTEVDRAMVSLQRDITFLGQISDAGAYMRVGGRKGLDKLLELQHTAPNESMRLAAQSMLETIGKNYEEFVIPTMPEGKEPDVVQSYLSNHKDELKEFSEPEKRVRLIPILIKEIRTSDDLSEVTIAFVALRKLTNQSFRVFDVDAVNRWCAENASHCK